MQNREDLVYDIVSDAIKSIAYLNLIGISYQTMVILLPSLGLSLLIMSNIFVGGGMVSESLLWMTLFITILFQVIFLILISFMRKNIKKLRLEKYCTLFITVNAMILAPILFSFSLHIISILPGIFEDVSMTPSSPGLGFMSIDAYSIDPEFFWLYSVIALASIGFSAALLIDIIQKWNLALKTAIVPVLVTCSVSIYMLSNYLLDYFISSQFGL